MEHPPSPLRKGEKIFETSGGRNKRRWQGSCHPLFTETQPVILRWQECKEIREIPRENKKKKSGGIRNATAFLYMENTYQYPSFCFN